MHESNNKNVQEDFLYNREGLQTSEETYHEDPERIEQEEREAREKQKSSNFKRSEENLSKESY